MENNTAPTSMPEYLSALIDDEAGEFEQKRVLDELKSNHFLCEKLSSFTLISEVMKTGELNQSVFNLDSSFLDGIHTKIEEEEQYNNVQLNHSLPKNQTGNSQSWLKPVGGFAIAASVAAIAVFGLQTYQRLGVMDESTVAENNRSKKTMIAKKEQLPETEIATIPTSATALMTQSSSTENDLGGVKLEYAQADLQTRSLLKRYVDSHMEYASTAAFVPSVRVIAYTDNQ